MFKRLMNWYKDLRAQSQYTKAFKKVTEQKFTKGEITPEQYAQCVEASNSTEVMRDSRRQLMTDPNMLGGITDWDWDTIYAWFVEYFIPAMKVIIPIVIMFLATNPTEDE